MEEELTTAMHAEFLGDEISAFDLSVMGACGAIRRGVPKKEALSQYGLTEEDYDNNIERILHNS